MAFKPISNATSLARAVQFGLTEESRFLDFKGTYPWRKQDEQPDNTVDQAEEFCRDVAQFANRDGGTLLVGITETFAGGRRVAKDVRSVDDVEGFKKWAEQAIRKHLAPATFSRSFDTISLERGNVVGVNVPPSLHLVALWHAARKRGIEYVYRTDHGKEWMNPDEVERHLMNSSRATQIALGKVIEEVSQHRGDVYPVELTPPLKPWVGMGSAAGAPFVRGSVFIHRALCTDSVVALRVALGANSPVIFVPHGLISEVWTTSDNSVGLCLKIEVVIRGENELVLEPFTVLG